MSQIEENSITLLPTKAGKGIKLVHNGVWFYTSKAELNNTLNGKQGACKFRTMEAIKEGQQEDNAVDCAVEEHQMKKHSDISLQQLHNLPGVY